MDTKSYFNHVAPAWNEMQSNFFSTRIRDWALGVAEIQRGFQAVDLGAGTGFITEALVRAGVHVIAVDRSEEILEKLNQKFSSTGLVNPRMGNAEQLPVPDQSVDRVFANMSLHRVQYPGRAIGEIKRILKHGGRLVITDLEKHDRELNQITHHDRWPGFYRSDIRHWLKTAGFSNIIIGTMTEEGCCAILDRCNEKSVIDIFLATGTA